MRIRLIPREERFFDMFVEDAANVLSAARHLLEEMLRTYDDVEQRAKELFAMEHHGDELSHAIGSKLNTTFVTPFDREDIHALISGLDDVLDLIEEVADTFILYHVDAPTPAAIQQADDHPQAVRAAPRGAREAEELPGPAAVLDRDPSARERGRPDRPGGRGRPLLGARPRPIDIIKWKDIYALLEDCIDKCEDVANIIEKIVVKHA